MKKEKNIEILGIKKLLINEKKLVRLKGTSILFRTRIDKKIK